MLEVLIALGLCLSGSAASGHLPSLLEIDAAADDGSGEAKGVCTGSDGEEAVDFPWWSWAASIGGGIGGLPGGVILGGGLVLGGLGVGIVLSFALGVASPLAYVALGALFLAVPILTAGVGLIPIGVLIGSLLGGGFDGRFAWQAASGALIGVLPALLAVAVAVLSFQVLTSAFGLADPQLFILQGSALALLAGLAGVSVGPIAVLGGVAFDWLWHFVVDGACPTAGHEPLGSSE